MTRLMALPADLRRRRRRAGVRGFRAAATGSTPRCAHRRAGDDDRHRQHLRRARHDAGWSATTWRRRRASQVYEAAGIGPDDVDVVELHDCFAHNELHHLRSAGTVPGRRGRALRRGRRQHLRRQGRHQPVRRAAVQGPSAGRDRAGAVLRADAAAARTGGRRAR